MCSSDLSAHGDDLRQPIGGCATADVGERFLLNVYRVHAAGGADPFREVEGEVPGAGADVRDARSGSDVQRVHHRPGPLPVVAVADFFVLRDGLATNKSDRERTSHDDWNGQQSHRDGHVL